MRYVCCVCGEKFDQEDADKRRELVGEFWGRPAYDWIPTCPFCNSDELSEDEGEDEDEEDEE